MRKLIKKFVRKVVPLGTAFEQRYAKKFGLIYAAGVLAIEAGLLPWPKDHPFKVVAKCFRLAMAEIRRPSELLESTVPTLVRAAPDPARFPIVGENGSVPRKAMRSWLGIRRKSDDHWTLALRLKDVGRLDSRRHIIGPGRGPIAKERLGSKRPRQQVDDSDSSPH